MSEAGKATRLLNSDGQWSRWEMRDLDDPASPGQASKPPGTTDSKSTSSHLKNVQPGTYEEGVQAGLEQALQAERDAARKEGFARGYEEGFAAATEKVRKQAADSAAELLDPIRSIAAGFSASVDAMSETVATQLIDLSITIARQLALDTLSTSPDIINKLVTRLLENEITPASRPLLYLHPLDLEIVEESQGPALSALGWQLCADEKLTRGGCLLKTRVEQIDATWETRCRTVLSGIRRRGSRDTPPQEEAAE